MIYRPFTRTSHLEGVPDNEFTIGELFNDGSTLRLELANFDVATMRHQTLTNEWSPHPLSRNLPTQPPELEVSSGDFQCPVSNCTRRCESAAAVACHMRKSADTAHNIIQPPSVLVVAIECPFCLSRFTNKWTTVLHLQSSYRKNCRHVQRGPYLDLKVAPSDFRCPLAANFNEHQCNFLGSNLAELQRHIASKHLLWSPAVSYSNDGDRIAGTSRTTADPCLAPERSRRKHQRAQQLTESHQRRTTRTRSELGGWAARHRPAGK